MIKNKKQFIFTLIILSIILFVTILISTVLGAAKINILDSLKILLSKIPLINKVINIENISATSIKIITDIRLTRILIAGLVGMGLSVCGAVYQGILKNSMADPYILGVSSRSSTWSNNSNNNR